MVNIFDVDIHVLYPMYTDRLQEESINTGDQADQRHTHTHTLLRKIKVFSLWIGNLE